MSTTTTNLGLIKPARGEKIDIDDINGNSDILDARIGAVPSNTSLQAQITALGTDTSAKAKTIYLSSSEDTWPKVWAKISALANGETAGIYFNDAAISAFSNGARTTGSPCGTISRAGTGKFLCDLCTSDAQTIAATVESASSSDPGTYKERLSSGYKNLGSLATVSAIESALNTELATIQNWTNEQIRFTYTGTRAASFIASAVYSGVLLRKNSVNNATVLLYNAGGVHAPVFGYSTSSGWLWGFIGSHITLNADDTTWAAVWGKLNILANGECATIYINSSAMGLISSNARSGEILYGTVMRSSGDTFHFGLATVSGKNVNAKITGASASTAGTYSEVVNATQCMETVESSSNTITFEVPYRKYMILLYGRYMTSIFNASTSSTTVYRGGDNPASYGYELTKAANSSTFTLTRTDNSTFYWATIIL